MTAPMDANRWARIRAIFAAASDRPLVDRPAFLDQACEGVSDLRREVE